MTDGAPPDTPPVLSNRRVLQIAVPVVISNATVPILGAVDTGVVGQMGLPEPIGAVGLGAIILTSLLWTFGFLRMGTTGLTSQAIGARDKAEVAALLSRALIVAVAAGLTLIVFQWPIFSAALALSPATPEVEAMTRTYLGVRIYSAPAAIAIYGLTGWLIAQERTRAVLVIQVVMNGTNILLDFWFVLGLGWGVWGVAVATAMSEVLGAAIGLWFCRAAFVGPAWRDWPRVFDRVRLKHMALVNTDILIRSLLLLSIFTSFLFFSAGLGDVRLAANQVLLQFLFITAHAMDGFALAAESLIGQAHGARARLALRRAALLTSAWGAFTAIAMALVFALAGGVIIDLMTTSPEVRQSARDFLPWMVLAPLTGAASWMLDGIFIGATRTRDMRNMMMISAAAYFAAVMTLIPMLDNHGLWAAFHISFIVRGLTLGWKYPGLEAAADKQPN